MAQIGQKQSFQVTLLYSLEYSLTVIDRANGAEHTMQDGAGVG